MGRFPQVKEARGSLKWTQLIANKCPELVNESLRGACMLSRNVSISWLSPIDTDGFAEYRDQAFLDLLGVRLEKRPLRTFWPGRGPQWDALARSDRGEVFLVESKAHVGELLSPGTVIPALPATGPDCGGVGEGNRSGAGCLPAAGRGTRGQDIGGVVAGRGFHFLFHPTAIRKIRGTRF